MIRTDNRRRIVGHYTHHIPVWVFIVKEDIDLLIEEKWRKRDEFSTLIAAIEKLTSPKWINLSIYQGNDFINVYKTLFNKNYAWWMKYVLTLSI